MGTTRRGRYHNSSSGMETGCLPIHQIAARLNGSRKWLHSFAPFSTPSIPDNLSGLAPGADELHVPVRLLLEGLREHFLQIGQRAAALTDVEGAARQVERPVAALGLIHRLEDRNECVGNLLFCRSWMVIDPLLDQPLRPGVHE